MNRMLRVLCDAILVAVPLLSEAQAPAHNEKVPAIQGGVHENLGSLAGGALIIGGAVYFSYKPESSSRRSRVACR